MVEKYSIFRGSSGHAVPVCVCGIGFSVLWCGSFFVMLYFIFICLYYMFTYSADIVMVQISEVNVSFSPLIHSYVVSCKAT